MTYLLATLFVLAVAYALGRKPIYHLVARHLIEVQYEHVRWIAICLEFTRDGCDVEAKIAAEQVKGLRGEINFCRRVLAWLQRRSTV